MIEQRHTDRNIHGIHHDGNDGNHQTGCSRSPIDRFQNSKTQETDGRRARNQGTNCRFTLGMLEELVTGEISPKEHTGNHHQADNGQFQVVEEHGSVGLHDGDEQSRRQGVCQHQLVQHFRIGAVEYLPLSGHVSEEHNDENGKDVFN